MVYLHSPPQPPPPPTTMSSDKNAGVGTQAKESLETTSGILTTTTALVTRENGRYKLLSLPRIDGIPIVAVALLDIANSADFPANVFNEIPVPTFAAVLMAIGATFALVMSGVAFVDARRSWRNIRLLRRERQELLARQTEGEGSSESEDEKRVVDVPDATLLSLNRRDIRTEFFERAGMETIMGIASFLVSVGTYMAIGGANHRVFIASNLLSGYIGNAPTAAYGLLNTVWSVIAWLRARKQQKSALSIMTPGKVRDALISRTGVIKRHAILSAVTCLVSGALGLLTPTYWEPYPVLLVCGILFVHTTWVFRHRVAYRRPLMSANTQSLVAGDIAREVDELLYVHAQVKKDRTFLSKRGSGDDTVLQLFTANFRTVVRLGMFEDFCTHVFEDDGLSRQLAAEWGDLAKVSPSDFLALDKFHEQLNERCKSCMEKLGRTRISVRIRFLLEALGTCLITLQNTPASEPPA